MFWSTVGRLIVVPLAFVLAAAAALFVLFSLGLERATQAVHTRASDEADTVFALLQLVREGVLLTSGLSILPALVVVIFGEVGRIRSALYYIVGGGAALAAVPLLARIGEPADLVLPAPVVWQVFATAGFAGGFIYWLVAGRNA
jgi:hypothetical protein